jgi:hypothetical protein
MRRSPSTVEERGLTQPARADDRHQLAFADLQVDAVEHVQRLLGALV